MLEVVAIIPARYHSTRFPGKALALINGQPMIQHVYQRVSKARSLAKVLVATDDDRIREAVLSFGGEVIMTSRHHLSGTDRVAEAVRGIGCDVVVNVQGDEPLITPLIIEKALKPFQDNQDLVMSTLKKEIDHREVLDPNLVKVVTDKEGMALYFSRSPIPYQRSKGKYFKHIGLYVYGKDFLMRFSKLKPTDLELTESLEQLRVLENGYGIKVVEIEEDLIGVDTPEDLQRVLTIMAREER